MNPITLDQAQTLISATLAKAGSEGMNSLCVVVLDGGGHMLACARQDGVPFGRVEIAHAKAFGAISIGMNSRTLEAMALERPHFIGGASRAVGGAVVPVAGGLIIVDGDGNRIGSVGVSGDTSDNDEIAARAGLEAAGLAAADR